MNAQTAARDSDVAIFYLTLADDRPRAIDRYIDYFEGRRPEIRRAPRRRV